MHISAKKTVQSYALPPEWEQHSATQLHWPANRQTWPGVRLQKVEQVYLDIIEVLHCYEPIHLFVANQKIRQRATQLLSSRDIDVEQLTFHLQPINDVWARDCGPVFVGRQGQHAMEYAITDWEYNAWGGKYPPFDDDNRLPKYVAEQYCLPHFTPGMVLEGGSIDTNGEGVLLTTESVLLNPNRNPALDKQEIEERLKSYLGVQKIVWLKGGLSGDDTDGHVDDVARFLNAHTILAMICEDPSYANYDILQQNYELLRQATGLAGDPFRIETLPLPRTKIEGTTVDGSSHVPASYANFYIANGVVLVPLYDGRYDRKALDLFERYFSQRKVMGIACNDLVWGQGSIHCITQQWYGV